MIELVTAANQPHGRALEFVTSPWGHKDCEVLTGFIQRNLEITIRTVETADVDIVAVNIQHGVPGCTDGMD